MINCSADDSVRVYKIIGKSQVKAWGLDVNTGDDDVILI